MPRNDEWLAHSRFASDQIRNFEVRALLDEVLANVRTVTPVPPPPSAGSLLDELTAPLLAEQPRASAAAEAALVLCAFCVAEQRVLSLVIPSDDLAATRLAGDRTVSEHLSRELYKLGVPATKGAFQSSTYRGGYLAAQAQASGLAKYISWLSEPGRSLIDVRALFDGLAGTFAGLAVSFPDLPALDSSRFTFLATRSLIERLRGFHSQGAYEQYLVAALLQEEYSSINPVWRIETKRVGSADAPAGVSGDVQVRRRMALVHAIEVSSSDWALKIEQAVRLARNGESHQVTIVAPAASLSSHSLAEALGDFDAQDADIAVVDLDSFLDGVSARLTPAARAAAMRALYGFLVQWERTRPDLVQHLVDSIQEAVLVADDQSPAESIAVDEVAALIDRVTLLVADDSEDVVQLSRDDVLKLLGRARPQSPN